MTDFSVLTAGAFPGAVASCPVSVILPARNEAAALPATLESIREGLPSRGEIVVVDGHSTDSTAQIAAEAGARVLRAGPGRGLQLQAGASVARGAALVFLHADTHLPPNWAACVCETLADPDVSLGAFRLQIDPELRGHRAIEWGVARRCRGTPLPFGDQALFARAEAYHAAGGFPDWSCFEDVALVERLRRLGRVVVRPEAVVTSGRCWAEAGVVRTTATNWLSMQAYRLGVPPERISVLRRRLASARIAGQRKGSLPMSAASAMASSRTNAHANAHANANAA